MAKSVKRIFRCPLAISIHGIWTDGKWQKTFASVMASAQINVESYDYGRYGLIRFLTPGVNDRMIDRFCEWYATSVKNQERIDLSRFDKRPSLIAHSFGTWIAAYAMLKYEEIRFDKIILFGSILPREFDWARLFARDQVGLVRNECGQQDPWPAWAGRLVARSGTGGVNGFDWFGSTVDNVRCDEFHHEEFEHQSHMETSWLPFLQRAPSPLVVVHGRSVHSKEEFRSIFDHTGPVIDREVYGHLPHYDEVEIPRGMALDWIRINPDIYTFLIDRNSRVPAGYLNAMPVEESWYKRIRAGEVFDNGISSEALVPFLDDQVLSGVSHVYRDFREASKMG